MSKKTNYYRQKGRADAAKGVYRNPNTWGDIGLGDSSDPEDGAAYDEGYYEKKENSKTRIIRKVAAFQPQQKCLRRMGKEA